MNQGIVDYYRCLENLARFELIGSLSKHPGYFRFGPDTVCYGQSSSGFRNKQPIGSLYDALGDVTTDGGTVRLPFDPDEIIENLRHEYYRKNEDGGDNGLRESLLVKSLYYWLRPCLPIPIRRQVQRSYLSDWQKI